MKLKEFFVDEIVFIPFKLWGKTHLFLILFVLVGLLLVYLNRKKIYQILPKNKRKITLVFASILLLNMTLLYVSSFAYDCFDYKTMLPFHLCYLANYFYMFVIFLKKESLYPYLYFLPFLGSIPAIIFFDVVSVWESFNFYLYLISHHLFIIMGLITFYMYPRKIKYRHVFRLILTLGGIYLFMVGFNQTFGTNYFFSEGIPPFILEMLPILNKFPVSLILVLMEILIIWVLYTFFNRQVCLLKKGSMI